MEIDPQNTGDIFRNIMKVFVPYFNFDTMPLEYFVNNVAKFNILTTDNSYAFIIKKYRYLENKVCENCGKLLKDNKQLQSKVNSLSKQVSDLTTKNKELSIQVDESKSAVSKNHNVNVVSSKYFRIHRDNNDTSNTFRVGQEIRISWNFSQWNTDPNSTRYPLQLNGAWIGIVTTMYTSSADYGKYHEDWDYTQKVTGSMVLKSTRKGSFEIRAYPNGSYNNDQNLVMGTGVPIQIV